MADETQSAADNLGPHLLGRIPSTPDKRDFKLADHLGDGVSPLDDTLTKLQKSHAAKATKEWAVEVTKVLKTLNPSPAPPSPSPSPSPTPTGDVQWANNEPVLDQGQYGTCVGNGWAQWGNTLPVDDRFIEKDARAIYFESTVIDGQPDNPDAPGGGQQGSQVRSGAKAMQNRGRLTAYAFASTVDEIKQFVQKSGAVVVGTDWYSGMFNPDANGYVAPTGSIEGGHCYLLVGDLASEGAFLFQNSWGSGWGQNGRFKMKYADFQKLLDAQGEAVAAVELANG